MSCPLSPYFVLRLKWPCLRHRDDSPSMSLLFPWGTDGFSAGLAFLSCYAWRARPSAVLAAEGTEFVGPSGPPLTQQTPTRARRSGPWVCERAIEPRRAALTPAGPPPSSRCPRRQEREWPGVLSAQGRWPLSGFSGDGLPAGTATEPAAVQGVPGVYPPSLSAAHRASGLRHLCPGRGRGWDSLMALVLLRGVAWPGASLLPP